LRGRASGPSCFGSRGNTGVTAGATSLGGLRARLDSRRIGDMILIRTLAELAGSNEATWFWANCPIPCCHSGALPRRAVIDQLGPGVSADRIRRALRCTVCGQPGGNISIASRSRHDLPPQPIPLDRVPARAAITTGGTHPTSLDAEPQASNRLQGSGFRNRMANCAFRNIACGSSGLLR
jgi:hypothetical protein